MSEQQFDLVIVGAGPGGYVAAIRAAQLGMTVMVVDKRITLGGVCLNEGCIPSKALLDSSEYFALARDRFAVHGIQINPPVLDLSAMMARKTEVVKKLTDGVAYLFKKNRIQFLQGTARLQGRGPDGLHQVVVTSEGQAPSDDTLIRSPRVLLAVGGEAVPLPEIPFDGQVVVSAKEALSFDHVPEHLIVAGAGFIGLELGSVWRRLGARVTVMEMLPRILPTMDQQAATALHRSLRKQGIEFLLETRITGMRRIGSKALVQYERASGPEEVDCDRLLVAVGRRPMGDGVGLEGLGVRRDEKGRVLVDDDFQTSVAGIYAIGDMIKGPMLAHKASEEGTVCVERMAGQSSVVEYEFVPGVVYTAPEGASVGRTEEQLKDASVPYRVGLFNFAGIGRARCLDETDGFVKVLSHAENDRVLGVHIVGPRASELIAEAAAVMSFSGTSRDIALICHAHPTLAEALREAALDVHKEALHA